MCVCVCDERCPLCEWCARKGPSLAAAPAVTVRAQEGDALDYSMEDLNSASATANDLVGPSALPGKVTLHYFGHRESRDLGLLRAV
eukprot:SAG22_NODE_8105_length_682_cov_1.293310_2_plen_86_part_00